MHCPHSLLCQNSKELPELLELENLHYLTEKLQTPKCVKV